jgi:hypothetical protein
VLVRLSVCLTLSLFIGFIGIGAKRTKILKELKRGTIGSEIQNSINLESQQSFNSTNYSCNPKVNEE